MLRKECLPHDVAGNRGQLLFLLLDRGHLNFFLARDCFFRERRVENTSESRSTPNFTSGFMTSTDTLKLLLPASLEMEPPTASISLAICSAVRVLVPFNSTLAIKRVIPFVCGVSARRPPRKTAPIATSGNRGSSRTSNRNPFESSNF